MAGGMFASHYESGGDIIEINGKLFKQFYGENYNELYFLHSMLYSSSVLKFLGLSSLISSFFFSFSSFFSFLFIFFVIGMSSGVAMGKHAGGLAEYRSSEGKAVTLPYRGMIKATINDILGGIRSSCTYVGAR